MAKPKLLTHEQCSKQLGKSHDSLKTCKDNIRHHLRHNWAELDHSYGFNWNRRHNPRQREVGHAIARIMARHRGTYGFRPTKADYTLLDAANGSKVRRESQQPKNAYGTYLEWIGRLYGGRSSRYEHVATSREEKPNREEEPKSMGFAGCKPWYPPKEREMSLIERYLGIKADVEYWQEMCRLTANRETQLVFEREERAA